MADSPRKSRGPRRCIVHIGLNKTGTTTIQGWLKENAPQLAARGIRYDAFEGAQDRVMHHAIGFPAIGTHLSGRLMPNQEALALLNIATLEDQALHVARFRAHAEAAMDQPDYRTYVISSEFLPFWLARPEWSRLFHDWLAQRFDRIRYVVYLRDQVDWVPSAYAQDVKSGGTRSLEEFIAERGQRNYFMLCHKWLKGVGPGRLDVRLLERDFLADGDLVTDFAGVIGANLADTHPPTVLNEALTADAVEKVRKINLMADNLPGGWSRERRAGAVAKLLNGGGGGGGGDKLRLSEEQALDVARRNAHTNEKLRRRFLKDRPVLFPKSHRILTEAGELPAPESKTKPEFAAPGSRPGAQQKMNRAAAGRRNDHGKAP